MKEYVKMEVSGVVMDPRSNLPVVILKDEHATCLVPIWIGVMEASSIAACLEGVELPRPMTHDLIKNMLDELGAKVLRVDVVRIQENTFFAQITVSQGTRLVEIDARPSDSIALAVRFGCDIGVAQEVIEEAGIKVEDTGAVDLASTSEDPEKLKEILASLPKEMFGKWKM
ncbi:MAG: bifunctional nuclease family protein [bacterium]